MKRQASHAKQVWMNKHSQLGPPDPGDVQSALDWLIALSATFISSLYLRQT
jgi:hypothetical protein